MCTVPPPQFGNPSCSPSNAFLASRETATDKTKMDEAKSFVAKTYLKSKLMWSLHIYLFDLLPNIDAFSRTARVMSDPNHTTAADLERAVAVIRYIATDSGKPTDCPRPSFSGWHEGVRTDSGKSGEGVPSPWELKRGNSHEVECMSGDLSNFGSIWLGIRATAQVVGFVGTSKPPAHR